MQVLSHGQGADGAGNGGQPGSHRRRHAAGGGGQPAGRQTGGGPDGGHMDTGGPTQAHRVPHVHTRYSKPFSKLNIGPNVKVQVYFREQKGG